jgi:hypothetical protein
MKVHYKIAVVMACVAAISISASHAQAQGNSSNPLREKAEARLEKKIEVTDTRRENVKNLRASTSATIKEVRTSLLEERKEMRKQLASSSPAVRKEILASSTEMFKKANAERREAVQKMRKDTFEIRKNALVDQLRSALENLISIRDRIVIRIETAEGTGRNMTEAEAALVIADGKLAGAKLAIDALAGLSNPPVATSTATSTASTTVEVDLTKPRQVGDTAIKAVKEARDALKKVVVAIAQNMGRGNGSGTSTTTATTTPATNATSTATTTPPTNATTTATSTASTTTQI